MKLPWAEDAALERVGASVTSDMVCPFLFLGAYQSGGGGRRSLRRVEKLLEAAPEHALPVEGHVGAHVLHARVAHELLVGCIALPLRRMFEEGKDDGFAGFGVYCFLEIGDPAVGNVVSPRLDGAPVSELLGDWRKLIRVLA